MKEEPTIVIQKNSVQEFKEDTMINDDFMNCNEKEYLRIRYIKYDEI